MAFNPGATTAEIMLSGPPWQGYPSSFGSKNEATLGSNGLVQGTEQLLVRLGIATSASSTGPMLVVTDDLHPNGYMPRYMVVS